MLHRIQLKRENLAIEGKMEQITHCVQTDRVGQLHVLWSLDRSKLYETVQLTNTMGQEPRLNTDFDS